MSNLRSQYGVESSTSMTVKSFFFIPAYEEIASPMLSIKIQNKILTGLPWNRNRRNTDTALSHWKPSSLVIQTRRQKEELKINEKIVKFKLFSPIPFSHKLTQFLTSINNVLLVSTNLVRCARVAAASVNVKRPTVQQQSFASACQCACCVGETGPYFGTKLFCNAFPCTTCVRAP